MTHRRAVALMVLVTLLWSIAGVVSRHMETAHGIELTFWRSGFNFLALAIALGLMQGRAAWRVILDGNRAIWISGACWGTMYTCFMIALTLTGVANVLVMMAVGPLLTALAARLFLDHRPPPRTWLAIGVACLGIGWMFGADAARGLSPLGSLVALAVPAAAAINWTLLQGMADRNDATDMLPAVMLGALLSAAVTLPLAWPLQASARDISLLALLGVVQLAIPCLFVVRLARILPGPEISLLALLEVIFGITWAWLGANEVPTSHTLTGGILVLAALIVNETLGARRSTARAVP